MRFDKICQEMAPAVRAILTEKQVLPETGILAGQALASAIMEALGHQGCPYNDIDVFLQADEIKLAQLDSLEHREKEAFEMGVPLAVLDEYRQITFDNLLGLSVAGTERDGLVNYVWLTGNIRRLSLGALITSFDMNCVEVAMDLQTNELVWSKDFEYFTKTRQLEVTNLSTPVRTLIRFFKKLDELKAQGVAESTAALLLSWLSYDEVKSSQEVLAAQSIHPRYVRILPELSKKLPSWLTWNEELERFVLSDHWPEVDLVEECQALDEADFSGLARLIPALRHNNRHQTSRSSQAFRSAISHSSVKSEVLDIDHGGMLQWSLNVFKDHYLEGQKSRTHLAVVTQLLKKHPALIRGLLGLTLDEQYQALLDIRSRAKSDGEHRWAEVELYATPVDMWNASNRSVFFQRVDRITNKELLTDPVFEQQEVMGVRIRELLTATELRTEGKVMSHCVGGYSSVVESGKSRILSLRSGEHDEHKSTVEVCFVSPRPGLADRRADATPTPSSSMGSKSTDSKRKIVVRQHFRERNLKPHESHVQALYCFLQQEAERLGVGVTISENQFHLEDEIGMRIAA